MFRTVDHGSRVEAAVLLAPVGGDAGALGEVAHRRRLHVDDLREGKDSELWRHATHVDVGENRGDGNMGRGEERQVEQVTHRLLQQLLQAVDVRPVPSLPLHYHAVSAAAAVAQDNCSISSSQTHLGDL